jgi:hypothetical protein
MSETKRYDRPSRHGAILGDALALIAAAGRKDSPVDLPEPCLTCAFRAGSLPNQTGATVKMALDCVLGVDPDRFACHHGMKNGEPSKTCVGYVAARIAPWSFVKEVLASAQAELAEVGGEGQDEVRAAFDRWIAKIDPQGKMGCYDQARAYARRSA